MRSYEIVPCEPAHIKALRYRLREADAREITCAGITAAKALWGSYKSALWARAVIVDGEVAAVWGCGGSALGPCGFPWLLTAPEIERIPVSFVREARREVSEMLNLFPLLQNWVASEYAKACRFLEVLGFTLDEPKPFGPKAALFRRFWMER